MAFNIIIWTAVGADYAVEQINPDSRRGRCIALGADSSALNGYSDTQLNK